MNQHWRNQPRPQIKNVPEHLTFAGAQKLAARLREYWAAKGKTPLVVVVKEESVRAWQARTWDKEMTQDKNNPGIYVVRSDMQNGWPQ